MYNLFFQPYGLSSLRFFSLKSPGTLHIMPRLTHRTVCSWGQSDLCSSSHGSLWWSCWTLCHRLTHYFLWLCGLATGVTVTVRHHRLPEASCRTDPSWNKGHRHRECVHHFCSYTDLGALLGDPQTTWPSTYPGLQYTPLVWTKLPSFCPPWTGRES